jgi:hypothetical protein
MHLTPRTLVMAIGVCLAGGLVLGVAGTIGSGVAAGAAQPSSSPSTTSAAADLGDSEITFTSPSASLTQPTTIAAQTPTPTPTPTASPSPRPADATAEPKPRSSQPTPRATTSASTTPPRLKPSSPAEPPANAFNSPKKPEPIIRKDPSPRGSWKPPTLGIGVVNIGAPRLTSGARPDVAVLCIPSTSCAAQGSSLTISAEADTVVVTWAAPASRNWRAWHADSVFSPPSVG